LVLFLPEHPVNEARVPIEKDKARESTISRFTYFNSLDLGRAPARRIKRRAGLAASAAGPQPAC
jgi:hypothetical protein